MFTASELPRIARCTASVSLEHHLLPENNDSRIGTLVHRAKETGELPDDDEAAAICQRAMEVWPAGDWHHEVAFSYDLTADAGKLLGKDIGRRYAEHGAMPDDICGTADGVLLDGDVVRIVELKTGWRHVSPRSWQTRFLALAAARAYDRSIVEVVVVTAHRDEAWTEVERYDVLDLDTIADDLRQLTAATKVKSRPQPGDWCRYCPALSSCPAAVGIIVALSHGDAMRAIAPEDAAKAYNTMKAAKAGLLRLEAQLKTLAQQKPIPIGDGQVYGLKVSQQWKFKDGAIDAISSMCLGPTADAISRSVSATSLQRAFGKVDAEAIIKKLQAMKLAESVPTEKMTEHRQVDG